MREAASSEGLTRVWRVEGWQGHAKTKYEERGEYQCQERGARNEENTKALGRDAILRLLIHYYLPLTAY